MKFNEFGIQSLMEITARPPVVFVEGKGSWLVDSEKKRYLDFVQGWGVNCLGHSPDIIAQTLTEQAHRLITPSPAYYNEPSIALSQLLVENSCFDKICFANSGAEANEVAIKLARKWGALNKGGAYEIITFENSFHGRTLATMSASGKPQFKDLFEPKVKGFPKAILNDLESVKRLIGDKTVAVMLEPIQGEGGVIPASDEFLRDLRRLTAGEGILLIVDEIQTGVGRTGKLWGHQHALIEPDMMSMGKMLGGGVPIAALAATDKVCCFAHGDQGGTYNGNPLTTAVGTAILKTVLAPGFLETVEETGRYFLQNLRDFAQRHQFGEARGRGLLIALDLGRDTAIMVAQRAFDAGLLLNAPRPNLLRFFPALNVSIEEIDAMLEILNQIIRAGI